LELPNRVVRDDAVSTDFYGRFIVEPFERGFGITIGNSLRRVLLSSLEGAAVTTVKINGVSHEFTSLDGVQEDMTDVLLNIKGIVLTLDGEGSRTMTVHREKAGELRAGEIDCDPSVRIINPDHKIATLTSDVVFHAEMTVRTGRGYATTNENRSADLDLATIPIDSVFSPVTRVRYRTEDMRVGQRTNYDRLILEVWTDGSVLPEDALVEAGLILRKHLNPFVMYHDLTEQTVTKAMPTAETAMPPATGVEDLLSRPITALNLSVRASNCLEAAKISTLRELVVRTPTELQNLRSFGKMSLNEVERKLADVGLSLGMRLDGGDAAGEGEDRPGRGDSAEGRLSGGLGMASPGMLSGAAGSTGVGGATPLEVFTMPE
jgi:DNA-directed RNA polymerase subunit alpha